MARGAATAITLPCALLPCQTGFPGAPESTRLLQWRKRERKFSLKALHAPITVQIELKPPPYSLNSLEPYMSRETLEYHWGRHHRVYVENLNRQILGTELDGLNLEDIIIMSYNKGDVLPAFNNAAQIWNHEFFWESMKPGGAGKPSGDLLELIERDFGSFERFINEFKSAASTQFGSGWVWLAYKANRLDVGNAVNPCPSEEDKKLVVVKSPNAVNPLVWDYSWIGFCCSHFSASMFGSMHTTLIIRTAVMITYQFLWTTLYHGKWLAQDLRWQRLEQLREKGKK
ncbi:superoxide dismutase [Fe], chloroplastic isoform X3 [Telopea speciosissima]|uniref:superoxide dismutase [Fe], chloroplastic isoform X3 n=1 Tax=Telopea speciosissima TaxID=54955 RepID=UPI001CC79936|nr:superoxide dismutase [Fe], chloroplastic isoform X3 [Telopea speciosissima]